MENGNLKSNDNTKEFLTSEKEQSNCENTSNYFVLYRIMCL